MSRQLCDRFGCEKPAVALVDFAFVCAVHAPADVEAHS